jgi:hypothetical protein
MSNGKGTMLSDAPNEEAERRAAAPASNEDALSQSSTPALAHRRRDPRDRSNRLLGAESIADAL